MPKKARTPAQQARYEKIQARMNKNASSTNKAVTPGKKNSTKKKRSSTPKVSTKKKVNTPSLSSAKSRAEKIDIIAQRLGRSPSPKPKKKVSSAKKKPARRSKSKRKANKKVVYQNPEDSEEDEVHMDGGLEGSDEEDGQEYVNDLDDDSDDDEVVEKTTTTTTTTVRKTKRGRSKSKSSNNNNGGNSSNIFTMNVILVTVIVACAFYFCMPIIRSNLTLPSTDDFAVLDLTKMKVDMNPSLIKKAYRRKARELHPDTGNGDEAGFVQVVEAYENLKGIYQEKFKAMGNPGDGSDSQVSTKLFVDDAKDKEIQLKASAIKRTQDITNIGMGAALGFCIAAGIATMG